MPIGPHRRFIAVTNELEDFKTVKNAFGGPSTTSCWRSWRGALRSWLISRGRRTEGVEMRALVPVSVRHEGEHDGGNRIVVMRGPLPIYIADPLNRLRFVSNAMDGLKESKQAVGAEVISGAQNFAPPTILAQASRLNFSTRLFNLIVTNVPGPQFPLYVLGREMLQAIPVAFLPENHAMAIAIMSYNGQMNFGLLGDFDALPDIDTIAENIDAELQTLIRLAREQQTATVSEPERELRVLGHPLRRPRGDEDHLGRDVCDTFQLAHEFLDLFGHAGSDRTGRGREREGHADVAAADLDAVDQPQFDEVQAQLGIDHVGQGVHHVLLAGSRSGGAVGG